MTRKDLEDKFGNVQLGTLAKLLDLCPYDKQDEFVSYWISTHSRGFREVHTRLEELWGM